MHDTRVIIPPVKSFLRWVGLITIAAGLAMVFFSISGLGQNASAAADSGALAFAAPTPTPASQPAQPLTPAAQGQAIFNEKCAGCHSIGQGKRVGPDLKDVTQRSDPQWIKTFISDPAKMIASDPTAKQLYQQYNNVTMPTLGLSAADINAVVEYLSNPGAVPSAPAAAAGTGDPVAGRRVFTGELNMTNGGTPCIACHSVTGVGTLDGGALGPDLTHVIQRLGEPGVTAALQTIAFPTMIGPFQNHPLTAKEQADLVAFLRESDRMQPPVPVFAQGAWTLNALLVLTIGLTGAAALLILLAILRLRLKQQDRIHLPVRKV